MDGVLSDDGLSAVTGRLLAWYTACGRTLPWRSDAPDPWIVLVSEFLLQQTRVETIAPRFGELIATIPTPEACARLSDQDLDRLWQGLGYYRRARYLRQAARQICERHDGRVPDTAQTLSELPGIGPYTTGAVMAIAFDKPVAGVDGNIARVWARWSGTRCTAAEAASPARTWLGRLFENGKPREVMQAVMDLGATVCTPRAPRCADCPLTESCAAARWPDPTTTPLRQRRRTPPLERMVHVWLTNGRMWFLEQRPPGLLGERPAPFCLPDEAPPRTLQLPNGLARLQASGPRFRHVFSHRRWSVVPALYIWDGDTAPDWPDAMVVSAPQHDLPRLGLPRAFSRALPWLTTQVVSDA